MDREANGTVDPGNQGGDPHRHRTRCSDSANDARSRVARERSPEDENATASTLTRVIGNDVALSARIIKVANSPMVRGAQVIEDLQMAISRMGVQQTGNPAMGIAMEQLFQATSDAVDFHLRESLGALDRGRLVELCPMRSLYRPAR
jgi:hypothetical protein